MPIRRGHKSVVARLCIAMMMGSAAAPLRAFSASNKGSPLAESVRRRSEGVNKCYVSGCVQANCRLLARLRIGCWLTIAPQKIEPDDCFARDRLSECAWCGWPGTCYGQDEVPEHKGGSGPTVGDDARPSSAPLRYGVTTAEQDVHTVRWRWPISRHPC